MRAWALALALVLASVWTRTAWSARAELDAARAAEARGELDAAIEHYQYALRSYTPLASAPAEAARALDAIARRAQQRGDRPTAIDALQRLRGGALATRGVLAPFDGWLPGTNRQLARLLAAQQLADADDGSLPPRARLEAERLRELQRESAAARAWSLLAVLAFAAWLGGAVFTLRSGLTPDARVVRAPALRGALWTAGAFALWLLALWRA